MTIGCVLAGAGILLTNHVLGPHAGFSILGWVLPIAGVGFGAAFAGVLRTILPLAGADQRAGLLSTFYVESYLAFSLPAIAAGIAAPALGLAATIYIYGGVVVVLAVISLAATRSSPA